MKLKIRFILLYLIIIISLSSFYFTSKTEKASLLASTKNQIFGSSYIQIIYHLGIDLLELKNHRMLGDKVSSIALQEDMLADINAITTMQSQFPKYKDERFNAVLKEISNFNYSEKRIYEFIDVINQQNYRIGDIAQLLFEPNRELYFLSSLLTHYMPEYLFSILITDNIIQEYHHKNMLSTESRNIYIEQNKLLKLSSQEVSEIISLLHDSKTASELSLLMSKIMKNVNSMNDNIKHLDLQASRIIYLAQSKQLIEDSHKLNNIYIQALTDTLEQRKIQLEDEILKNKLILILTLSLITVIALYFYRVSRSNSLQEKKIQKMNSDLDKVVLYSGSDLQGNITHISSAMLKLSGYTKKEVIGKKHNIFKHSNNNPEIFTDLWETITKKKTWTGDIANQRKDGTCYWVNITITPELDDKKRLIAYSAHRTDITHIKALESEKIKTQEALAFKSKFLSNMSHEIRTPLNGIIGLSKLAFDSTVDSKQKDLLKNVVISSQVLLGIINDILDISKIEAGKMTIESTPLELHALVESLKSIFYAKALEKDLEFDIEFKGFDNFNFMGDSLRITQILNNLLSNAMKFTQEGSIKLIITQKDNNLILFEVSDTGIGLKPRQKELLFQEFIQADMDTSRKYGGTGLGLSISKHLVELMQGRIWIESVYEKGSSFYFEIPLNVDHNSLIKKEEDYESESELEKKVKELQDITILVAEDNKMNQMVLSLILEKTSITLDFADDGSIALGKFKNNPYDLILMDIQMPIMNGYEATHMMRLTNQEIPIIALTANVMQEDIQRAYKAGMNDFLAKPIEVDKLYLVLLEYLG